MCIFKPCLTGTGCRVLPSPHPKSRSEQLDQHGVRVLQELEHCAGCLGDICTASCRHDSQIKTETGKQLFLIICWDLLSLELLRFIYITGHLSLRLLLQSCFVSGTVHLSSPCATPRQVLHCRINSSSVSTAQLSVKLLQYNAVRTPAIQQPKESTSALSLNKSTDHIPVSCWKESQRQVVTQKEMDFALSKGQAYYSDGSTLSHHCVALLFLALLFLSFFFKPSMLALSKFEYA